MKSRLSIPLKDIPNDGQEFHFTQQHSEMSEFLKDILEDRPFTADFRITPAGQAYDLTGKLSAQFPQLCSFCCKEITQPVKANFHHFILIGEKTKCDLKVQDQEQAGESESEVFCLEQPYLHLGELLHEELALQESLQPLCQPDCKGLCPECGVDRNVQICACEHHPALELTPKSAFSVLKDLKLS